MYNKILIPLDLAHTEKVEQALEVARKLAGDNAEIKLVNVIGDLPVYAAAELPKGFVGQAKAKAEKALAELTGEKSIGCTAEVRSGTVYRAILSAAEEWGADLIVVGSHKPDARDYLLGSTAAKVVRHAQCPVLVLR